MTSIDKDEIPILHLDDAVVVASKPGGLLVHRSRESTDTVFLLQRLGYQLGRFLYPIHRLDRAASGVIAMALSREAAKNLQSNMQAEDAIKEYIVLVRGEAPEQGETDRPLTSDKGIRRPCRTSFKRLAFFNRSSLLRVRIATGRRHQIRRHLAHLRHQVIGDTTYGKGRINNFLRETYGLPRLFLHACLLDVKHPIEPGRLRVEAPLASDLREYLLRLPGVDEKLVASL